MPANLLPVLGAVAACILLLLWRVILAWYSVETLLLRFKDNIQIILGQNIIFAYCFCIFYMTEQVQVYGLWSTSIRVSWVLFLSAVVIDMFGVIFDGTKDAAASTIGNIGTKSPVWMRMGRGSQFDNGNHLIEERAGVCVNWDANTAIYQMPWNLPVKTIEITTWSLRSAIAKDA